jgi:SOS-response transcriptional repressor LexA
MSVRYEAADMLDGWLRDALTSSGLNQTELARRLTARLGRQIDRSAVSKMTLGKRAIAGDEMIAIAEITGAKAPDAGDGAIKVELPSDGLPVLGAIQAGAWLDIAVIDPDSEPEIMQVPPDKRFPRNIQYVLLVRGNSMDLDWPDGSYVTCVDFAASGLSLREGQTLHVERREGHRTEITLKMLHKHRQGGAFWLYPRSSDPKWQPIPLDARQGEAEVVVKGVITGGWRPSQV